MRMDYVHSYNFQVPRIRIQLHQKTFRACSTTGQQKPNKPDRRSQFDETRQTRRIYIIRPPKQQGKKHVVIVRVSSAVPDLRLSPGFMHIVHTYALRLLDYQVLTMLHQLLGKSGYQPLHILGTYDLSYIPQRAYRRLVKSMARPKPVSFQLSMSSHIQLVKE